MKNVTLLEFDKILFYHSLATVYKLSLDIPELQVASRAITNIVTFMPLNVVIVQHTTSRSKAAEKRISMRLLILYKVDPKLI